MAERIMRSPRLPVTPLRHYLNKLDERYDATSLATLAGIDARRLRALKNSPQRSVHMATADRILCATGKHISEVYPEYHLLP